jgi:hypothetical protein
MARLFVVTLLAGALAASLSSCAKKHLYPGDRRPDDQVSHIEAERFLLAGMEFTIDGTAVGSLAQYFVPPGVGDTWKLGKPTVGASVLPGNHTLSAHAARYGWVTAARTACAAMTFQAVAGERYSLSIDNGSLIMRSLLTGEETARTSFAACLPEQGTAAARR